MRRIETSNAVYFINYEQHIQPALEPLGLGLGQLEKQGIKIDSVFWEDTGQRIGAVQLSSMFDQIQALVKSNRPDFYVADVPLTSLQRIFSNSSEFTSSALKTALILALAQKAFNTAAGKLKGKTPRFEKFYSYFKSFFKRLSERKYFKKILRFLSNRKVVKWLFSFHSWLSVKESQMSPSRRLFLKTGIVASALAASEFLSPDILRDVASQKELANELNLWKREFTTVGRDAIMAHRLENDVSREVSKELGFARKPVILVQIGVAHSGIEQQLINPDFRQKVLESFRPEIDHIERIVQPQPQTSWYRVYKWNPKRKRYDSKPLQGTGFFTAPNSMKIGPKKRMPANNVTRREMFASIGRPFRPASNASRHLRQLFRRRHGKS